MGIWDTKVSQKLQMSTKLTLEDAKKENRQREAMREQSQQLQIADNTSHSMGEVSRSRPHHSRGGATSNHSRQRPRDKPDHKCTRCGKPRHKQGDIYVLPKQPPVTSAKGHYSSQCFSKTVAAITQEGEAQQDSAFLGPVTTESESTWTSTLKIAGEWIQFKLDTSAEVTAVSEATYHKLRGVSLRKATRIL